MSGSEFCPRGRQPGSLAVALAAVLAGCAATGVTLRSNHYRVYVPPEWQVVEAGGDGAIPTLLRKIAQRQRIVERSARTVAGHETEPCPLVHPQVGRLRCGEWLLFAGIHDVMHLEQLHDLLDR